MQQGVPLSAFPILATRNGGEFEAWMRTRYANVVFEPHDGDRHLDIVLNRRPLATMSVSYTRYGAPVRARTSEQEHFLQGFPLRGAGEVAWNGHPITVQAGRSGSVGGPGASSATSYSADFEHLMVSIPRAAVTRTLAALIDQPIDPPLQLKDRAESNPDYFEGQLRLVKFIACELNRSDGLLPAAALAELEQAFIISYLHATPHNYTHLLEGPLRPAAPWQVRRALDYIEQNWDQPITIEALALVTRTSARSLFHLFKKSRGVSPMVYVKQVRLRHAREMLSRPDSGTTVTSVAFHCGFSNMGHFAKDYVSAFGEKPSATLAAAR